MIYDHHEHRVWFLLRLSMTCRMMRLRLLPWIWERLEFLVPTPRWTPDGRLPSRVLRKFNAVMTALCADVSLGTNVKYFRAFLSPWSGADSCPLKVHVRVPCA